MTSQPKQQIIDAAINLFLEKGSHRVTVADVLMASGISKSAFYREFKTKDDLVVACLEYHADYWITQFLEGFDVQKVRSGKDFIAEVFDRIERYSLTGEFKGSLALRILFEAKGIDKQVKAVQHLYGRVQSAIHAVMAHFDPAFSMHRTQAISLAMLGMAAQLSQSKPDTISKAKRTALIFVESPMQEIELPAGRAKLDWLVRSEKFEIDSNLKSPKNRLRNAGENLIGKFGSERVGVSELISEAGVARSTLYDHFGTKQSLVEEFLARRSNETYQIFDWLIEQNSLPIEDRLVLLLDLLCAYFNRSDRHGPVFLTELFQNHPETELWQIAYNGISGYRTRLMLLLQQSDIENIHEVCEMCFLVLQGALIEIAFHNTDGFRIATMAILDIIETQKVIGEVAIAD